jgi:hypothetical protein
MQLKIDARGTHDPVARQRILDDAALQPGIDEALAEGDAAYREYTEGLSAGELRSSDGSPGLADR